MKKILLAFTIVVAFCSCSFGADSSSLKLDNLEREVARLSRKVDDLSRQLSDIRSANYRERQEIREEIARKGDFVFKFGLTINLLFLGVPFFAMCLAWINESIERKRKYLSINDIEKIVELVYEAKMKGNLINGI